MSLKKYAGAAALVVVGIVFLLIPGLEPLGAISILGGLGYGGVKVLSHGK